MAVPTQIRIAELDYDQILTNLVAFMRTDPAFADYDFAGSGLRLLSRVLAYVVFYQNYYLAAGINEAFLDTAQLRSSVVSHARMLGYDAHGTQGARYYADTTLELDDTSASSVTLPRQTLFVLAADPTLTFYTVADTEFTQNANSLAQYTATGVELVEGSPVDYQFTVDLTDPTQRFVIPNANIDYSTISVIVQSGASNTTFLAASDLITIANTDPVFFVQEAYDGFPELKFGNDVVGAALESDDVIYASFLISRGTEGNSVRGPFTVTSNIANFTQGYTAAVDANTVLSMGGTDSESLDDVRLIAPLVYQTQNRCVTTDDYKAIILEAYGDQIAAINVFGGEQGDPNDPANRPLYGRVFVALKPAIGLHFTSTFRKNVEDLVLKPRAIVGTIPQVIDPDYVFMNVKTSVKYDPRLTTLTRTELETAVEDAILTYTRNNVELFDNVFYYSKFTTVIDAADPSVVSSVTQIDLEKRIYPVLGEANQFVVKFNCELRVPNRTAQQTITEGSIVPANQSAILLVIDHPFTYMNDAGETQEQCFLYEWAGIIHVAFRNEDGEIEIFKTHIGTFDATTGLVMFDNFAPTAIDGALDVRVRVLPVQNDFSPHLNQLFTIDDDGVSVQILNVLTATPSEQTTFFTGGILF